MDLTPLFPRYIQPRLLEVLEDTPVILIHGARQTGKTTLALWGVPISSLWENN